MAIKVLGFEVTDETIEKALSAFSDGRKFTLSDLKDELARLGVPLEQGITDRAGDRILQLARKNGTHVYSGGKWSCKLG